MSELSDYSYVWDEAILKIKEQRYSTASDNNILMLQVLFDFCGQEYSQASFTIDCAKNIAYYTLSDTIVFLFSKYNRNIINMDISKYKANLSGIISVFFDADKKEFLFLKRPGIGNIINRITRDKIMNILIQENKDVFEVISLADQIIGFKYVSIVYDEAYLEIINHNEDDTDPSRGTNIYSLKWLFTEYFSINEYNKFVEVVSNFKTQVEENLGFIYIRSLTPIAKNNFKNIVERKIKNHPYDILIDNPVNYQQLTSQAYEQLRCQFIDKNVYTSLLSNCDFAQSIVTSEWLYYSMKKAKAIDLTIIGVGYFKAIEQLLFNVISIYEERAAVAKQLQNGESDKNEFTIGAMAHFIRDNLHIFRDDITYQSKKYIREVIFSYKDLRNGYLHRHNISDWSKIEEIRNASYNLMFLVLGGFSFTSDSTEKLCVKSNEWFSDYYRLCEYIDYHSDIPFYFEDKNSNGFWNISCFDESISMSEDGLACYSGVYFKRFPKIDQSLFKNNAIEKTFPKLYKMSDLPQRIYKGRLEIGKMPWDTHPVIVEVIFEKGKFIGKSVSDEDCLDF